QSAHFFLLYRSFGWTLTATTNWRWVMMELATLASGVIILWRYRLPFLVMPIAVTLLYMSMDLAPFLFGDYNLAWVLKEFVSV
ncbi:MAG: hypothetical protein ACP5Q0_05520, partial [Halothiobacillus sp.]